MKKYFYSDGKEKHGPLSLDELQQEGYLAFDENKNWTKRLNYDSEEDEEPGNIVIRDYEYY